MLHVRRILISSLAALTLTACTHAPVREDQSCTGVDWWEAGRTDGVAGLPLAQSLKESNARCDASKHPVDLEAFENGHDAGLVDYCTPAQGLALGRSGLAYENACPAYLEGPFLQQYRIGEKLRASETQPAEAHAEKPTDKSSAAL
jgi:hypothetical protein